MKKVVLLISVISILSGCGGGGGGGGGGSDSSADNAATSTASFPVEATISALYSSPHNFSGTYTDTATGDVYAVELGIVPGANNVFEGEQARTANLTQTYKKNGTPLYTSTLVNYFKTNPFTGLGTTYGSGEFELLSSITTLPVSAKVGDSGIFASSKGWNDNARTTLIWMYNISWELQHDTASTAYLCINYNQTFGYGITFNNSSECYKIDTNGNVLGFKLTLTGYSYGWPMQTVTFKS